MIDWYGQVLFCYCLAVLLYFSLLVLLLRLQLRLLCYALGWCLFSLCTVDVLFAFAQNVELQQHKQRENRRVSRGRGEEEQRQKQSKRDASGTQPGARPHCAKPPHGLTLRACIFGDTDADADSDGNGNDASDGGVDAVKNQYCAHASTLSLCDAWDGGDGDGDDDSGGTRCDGKCKCDRDGRTTITELCLCACCMYVSVRVCVCLHARVCGSCCCWSRRLHIKK